MLSSWFTCLSLGWSIYFRKISELLSSKVCTLRSRFYNHGFITDYTTTYNKEHDVFNRNQCHILLSSLWRNSCLQRFLWVENISDVCLMNLSCIVKTWQLQKIINILFSEIFMYLLSPPYWVKSFSLKNKDFFDISSIYISEEGAIGMDIFPYLVRK